MGFRSEWGAQFPTQNSTALDAPPGYITLYTAFFREGNFRLPMKKFTGEVLTNYGLHISQINTLWLPQITHFEFICRANCIEPTFEMFNIFYYVSYTGGFYSFNCRSGGFFYINRGVIPIDRHYRPKSEGIPRVNVSINFVDQEWYKVLTRKVTSISQLEKRALVGAGMSMLWVPQNPRGIPVYGYQGKVGYNLLNVLDPKAVGALLEAIVPEGKPVWLDQIRDHFLHPTSDSFASYANAILGEDGVDDLDDTADPTREEVIVLSSEGSNRSREGLIPRSRRVGPAQGAANKPVNEPAGDDVNVPTDAVEQLETRKKKRMDKSEKKKKVEEPIAGAPRKQPSNFYFLDYVVVSDTLSGLDAVDKRAERDPDDDATLTEIMEKKIKSKLQKRAPPTPSESEVDLGVFSAKRGNLLEKISAASSSKGVKSGKAPRKVDISKITPPTSPPSRTFGLSPPHDGLGEKKKANDVEVEQVGEGGAAGAGSDAGGAGGAGGDGRGEGVDTEAESSEATPRHTIYTKRLPGSGGGGTSGVPRSPEYENVQAGYWDTHNPACTDLPHAPRWNLMGEDTLDFENAKKVFAEEREKFNAEKKGLAWRVADAEEKLAKEKQLSANKQKDWEAACERTNKEMQTQRDAIIWLSGEKKLRSVRRLSRSTLRTRKENKTSAILVEETTADCKWLLARAVPLISQRIAESEELAKYMSAAEKKEALKDFNLYKVDCAARYAEKRQEFESFEFAIVKAAGKLSRKPDGITLLKRALGDEDPQGGDAGTSRQG
ncbi:hypothetical protein Hanom_Chr13g01224921 [Helianthus anomalus]